MCDYNNAGNRECVLRIEAVDCDKMRYMPLLLIGDESEAMVARYLDRGLLHVGFVGAEAVAVCVTTLESETVMEVKNLAVKPEWQRKGIGRRMLAHAESLAGGRVVMLGTGETPSTLRFYRCCGYMFSHRVPDFFTVNYPEPIVEEGVQLKDMIYMTKQT